MRNSFLLSIVFPLFSMFLFMGLGSYDSNNNLKTSKTEEKKCVDCHSDLLESTNVHSPANESCSNCHDVELLDHTENGARGLKLTQEIPVLCFKCHETVRTERDSLKFVHQAMQAENSCINCHSPHSSEEKHLLQNNQKKMCLSCHDKDKNSEGEKVLNIKKLLLNSKVIHPPLENGGCSVCHKPHGSENNYLLISNFPKGFYAPATWDSFEFCWECHDSDLLEAPTTETATNFRNGEKNLHFVHMNGKKGRNCTVCHNVHASSNEHLIEDKVMFGGWEMPIRFKTTENGGTCFPGCHNEEKYQR
ncbi:MAG: hypothetical protein IPH88_19310 [Bacteroidales bacterium]|nr:hypothetical protein [Bacteroidales bacterium]